MEKIINELKAKPILFSTEMVRAIHEDRKIETRRIIKPQYQHSNGEIWTSIKKYNWFYQSKIENCESLLKVCPYGKSSGYLWVRETWYPHMDCIQGSYGFTEGEKIKYPPHYVDKNRIKRPVDYKEKYPKAHLKWKPSIFMPKSACRLILKIESIRVERLQDITEESAINEGIEKIGEGFKSYEIIHSGKHKNEIHPHAIIPKKSPITSYKELWESINGLNSWDINPFVWVIRFKKI